MSDRRESAEALSPPSKRRKVRKGTHSCWECRRRKIKCQFDSAEDVTCIGCKQRGSQCRSQEFDDDNAPEPGQKADPPLARRLDRLEQMMERLVDKIVPDDVAGQPQQAGRQGLFSSSPVAVREGREASVDILETANSGDGPIAALLAMRHESLHRRGPSESGPPPVMSSIETRPISMPATTTPQQSMVKPAKEPFSVGELPEPKHFWVCTTLRAVIPPQRALEAIVAASPGAFYVVAMAHNHAEMQDGKVQPVYSIAKIPPMPSHPLLLARHALQLLNCVQQLPPAFDWEGLGLQFTVKELMHRLISTIFLVTSNDDLMGYSEGLECLLLQGFYQANCGSLRKAWITYRRALSLAQLMGIDKGSLIAFRSCDPSVSATTRPSADYLWYRIVCSDRYLSLLLGLPVGSHGDDFASEESCKRDTPVERLEKVHAVLSARILERNHTKDPAKRSNYAATQEIDIELDSALKSMEPGWWAEPKLDPFGYITEVWENTTRMMNQIHHHTLLILLHIPYMLRDLASCRYDFSKTTCTSSAREVLKRYITFRSLRASVYSCRMVDYAALIATMTLLLSYLSRRKTERELIPVEVWEAQRQNDRGLVDRTKKSMEHIAGLNTNKMGSEGVAIINLLLPIINKVDGPEPTVILGEKAAASTSASASGTATTRDGDDGRLQFSIPYLGTIDLYMAPSKSQPSSSSQPLTSAIGSDSMVSTACHQSKDPPFESDWLPSFNDGFMQFAPYQGTEGSKTSPDAAAAELTVPDLTADGEDWAFQGVDTAYWSLFEGEI